MIIHSLLRGGYIAPKLLLLEINTGSIPVEEAIFNRGYAAHSLPVVGQTGTKTMRDKLNYFYDKFFKAALATAANNEDAEKLYQLLQTAADPQGQLYPEYLELYKDCSAVFVKSTRASEVLQFTRMFKKISAAPWVAEKLLNCATRVDHLLEYVTFLSNLGEALPEGYETKFHKCFVSLCPSWAQFYAYVTFFKGGAYCPAVEEYFLSLSVGEFNQKKLWELFPEWRTPRLKALYESTTIYGLTLD